MKLRYFYLLARNGEFISKYEDKEDTESDVVTVLLLDNGRCSVAIKNSNDQHSRPAAKEYGFIRLVQAGLTAEGPWKTAAPSPEAIERSAQRSGFKNSEVYMKKLLRYIKQKTK